jgi:DNA-binding response OmpR family regulator
MTKILLVDDHSDIRRLIRITLGKAFEVLEAEDGVTALEIVLDAIKADPVLATTRVIMVTARGQASDYEDGMLRGADAYFIKPFSPLQLVAAIKEILAPANKS